MNSRLRIYLHLSYLCCAYNIYLWYTLHHRQLSSIVNPRHSFFELAASKRKRAVDAVFGGGRHRWYQQQQAVRRWRSSTTLILWMPSLICLCYFTTALIPVKIGWWLGRLYRSLPLIISFASTFSTLLIPLKVSNNGIFCTIQPFGEKVWWCCYDT